MKKAIKTTTKKKDQIDGPTPEQLEAILHDEEPVLDEVAELGNKCPNCKGSGRQNADDLCSLCQGLGHAL